jgi:hypothetical protein
MKKVIALAMFTGALAAFGCTTTSPEKRYEADAPPKLEKAAPIRTDMGSPKVSSNTRPAVPENIDANNYLDAARALDNGMRDEARTMSKAGR